MYGTCATLASNIILCAVKIGNNIGNNTELSKCMFYSHYALKYSVHQLKVIQKLFNCVIYWNFWLFLSDIQITTHSLKTIHMLMAQWSIFNSWTWFEPEPDLNWTWTHLRFRFKKKAEPNPRSSSRFNQKGCRTGPRHDYKILQMNCADKREKAKTLEGFGMCMQNSCDTTNIEELKTVFSWMTTGEDDWTPEEPWKTTI